MTEQDRSESESRSQEAAGKSRPPYLIELEGNRVGFCYLLHPLPRTIGRKDADIIPDSEDQSLSRLHATVEMEGTDVCIVDNNSTNGTTVNGNRIDRHLLRDGDKIAVGQTVLKFVHRNADKLRPQSRTMSRAFRDRLTGAFNKAHFKEKYLEAFAESMLFRKSFGLLLIEVDRFNETRDKHGLKFTNQVLIDLTDFLSSILLEGQELFRLGGAKFGVLLHGSSARFFRDMGEMIRQSVELFYFSHEGASASLTVSLGVAFHGANDAPPLDPFAILNRAEEALEKARRLSGNMVCG